MDKLLIDKFPTLDPNWPDELKSKWFSAFNELLKRTGPAYNIYSYLLTNETLKIHNLCLCSLLIGYKKEALH